MTISLVATAFSASGGIPPRVRLDVTSTTGNPFPLVGSEYLNLYRNDPDGVQRLVILPLGSRLSGGIWTGYDYHAPRNVPVSYLVTAGSVVAQGSASAGYYNYAPSPNVLPSSVAALGNGGPPTGVGWPSAASIVGSALRYTVPSNVVTNVQMVNRTVPTGAPGTYTMRVEFGASNVSGKTYGLLMTWLDVHRNPTGTTVSTTATDPAALMLTTTRPGAALSLYVQIWIQNYVTGTYFTVTGITLNAGASATSIPAPVFIPQTPAPALLSETTTWLLHPTNPTLAFQVMAGPPGGLASVGDRVRGNKYGQFDIPGRKTPITITDGQRKAVTSSISINTQTDAMDSDLQQLLEDGGPILIATPGTEGWDVKWEWVQPGDTTRQNKADWTAYPYRLTQIPYIVVDQPVAFSGTLWTCADVAALAATCSAAAAIYTTAEDMATDTRH